jgi:hypothetical protein
MRKTWPVLVKAYLILSMPTKTSLIFAEYKEILSSKIHLSIKLELKQGKKDGTFALVGYTLYGCNYKLQIRNISPVLPLLFNLPLLPSVCLSLLIADHLLFNLTTSVHSLLSFRNSTFPLSGFQITL